MQYAFPSIFFSAAGPITSRTIPSVFWAQTLWLEKRKAQNKQMFPDAADTVHPWIGCSKMMHKRAASKNTTATGFLSAQQQDTSSVQFPTRTVVEPNSAEPAYSKLSTSNKEIKGHPEAKMKFKTFIYSVRRSFSLSLKVLSRRDCWPAIQFYYSLSHCHSLAQDHFFLSHAFIWRDEICVSVHFQSS